MATVSYTLSPDGQASSNTGGNINAEWWSATPETTIGNRYQVMATVSDDEIPVDGTLNGIFGQWISLSQAATWSLDSVSELGGVAIFVQIRDLSSGVIQDSATIILGFIDFSATGNLYFQLNEPAAPFTFSYSSTTIGTLSSDISLSIGDTVTFSYTANNVNPLDDENFIESADGVNFFGWQQPSQGDCSFVGYTATLNGSAINSGDQIPYAVVSNYPVGGNRLSHTVVLTATTATDVRFIGTSGNNMPIFDVTIVTSGQTWIFPIDTRTVTNPDSNGSGTNLVLSANNFWLDQPVMFNSGTTTTAISPYFNLESKEFNEASNNLIYAVASMRVDGLGAALDTAGSSHWMGSSIEDVPLAYGSGFTVETIVRYNGTANSSGRACGVISATSNSFDKSLWVLGFDDYDGSAGGSGTVTPTFSLLQRNTIYDRSANASNNVADLRGVLAVSGNIYHLLATIRPSNNSIEFYVNGVSVGSATLSQSAFDAWAIPNGAGEDEDVLLGNFPTRFDIGARYTNGAWRVGQDSHIQDLKVHLLEADDAFALQQASVANFT